MGACGLCGSQLMLLAVLVLGYACAPGQAIDWSVQTIDSSFARSTAQVGNSAENQATYDVYSKPASITFINNCSDNSTKLPIKVAGLKYASSGSYEQRVYMELDNVASHKALVLNLPYGPSDSFVGWAFAAYPMPWKAGLYCPDCDSWTDVGQTTSCSPPEEFKCPTDPRQPCTGRRNGSMWDTRGDPTRKRVIAYCSPDWSFRKTNGSLPDTVTYGCLWGQNQPYLCGARPLVVNQTSSQALKDLAHYSENCDPHQSPCCGDIEVHCPPTWKLNECGDQYRILMDVAMHGTRWELTRDNSSMSPDPRDWPDLSTNYKADVCHTDPCRASKTADGWEGSGCSKAEWDNTVRASANVFFNIPVAIDTNAPGCSPFSVTQGLKRPNLPPVEAAVAGTHWECMYAGCPDAYQTPVDPTKQWHCSKDAERRYTVTFCPRGSVLVDDADENTGTLGKQSPAKAATPSVSATKPATAIPKTTAEKTAKVTATPKTMVEKTAAGTATPKANPKRSTVRLAPVKP